MARHHQSWFYTSEDISVGRGFCRLMPVFFFISTLVPVLLHSVASNKIYKGSDALGSYAVANGRLTSISKHPSSVFVYVSVGICSGTLISKRFILTASHCTFNPGSFQVFVGGTKRFSGITYKIGAIIRHPDYGGNITGRRNDLALLYTTDPVKLSNNVKVAELIGPMDINHLSKPCYVAGWGRLSRKEKIFTDELHEGVMVETNPENCNTLNNSFSPVADICMKRFKPELQTTANGDSGAGLFCYSKARNMYVLTGVNSGGIGLDITVFSKVLFYTDWIKSIYQLQKNGVLDKN